MLNDQERAVIKATVPALRAHGETITRRFYSTMLEAHPELFNYFNPANQRAEGGQARSLAASVLTYAENIDRLGALGGMVERIAAIERRDSCRRPAGEARPLARRKGII